MGIIKTTDNALRLAWKHWFKSAVGGLVLLALFAVASLPPISAVSKNSLLFLVLAFFNYHFFIAGIASSAEKNGSLLAMSISNKVFVIINFYAFAIIGTGIFLWLAVHGV